MNNELVNKRQTYRGMPLINIPHVLFRKSSNIIGCNYMSVCVASTSGTTLANTCHSIKFGSQLKIGHKFHTQKINIPAFNLQYSL